MANRCCTLLLLLLIVHRSIQKSTPESSTYKGAIVEYKPAVYKNNVTKTLEANAKNFFGFIGKASAKDADIIVFPEFGLTSLDFPPSSKLAEWATIVPEPSRDTICHNSSTPVSKHLEQIACAANMNGIYVVVNLIEKDECTENVCGFFYVSNVVFDRKGKIIARYRKRNHLEFLGLFDTPKTREISTFETDFGVTFGNVISNDILYEETIWTLARTKGINDFVITTAWRSEMPFLTSVQIHVGWAYTVDVNALVAGYKRIEHVSSGSGIYAGRQVIRFPRLHDDYGTFECEIISKKPKRDSASLILKDNPSHQVRFTSNIRYESDELRSSRDILNSELKYSKLDDFKTEIIVENDFTEKKLSHHGIECKFQINVTNLSSGVEYRMVAYDGNMSGIGTQICTIVQCGNNSIDSCGHIHGSSTTFNSITIVASHANDSRIIMMPNTLSVNLITIEDWTFHEQKNGAVISLKSPTQNLITFGIWGRNFNTDTHGSASKIFRQLLWLPLFLVLLEKVHNFS